MEKTNFTFVHPTQWMKLAFLLVATLCFGLTPITGQGQDDADPVPGEDICLPPALTITGCDEDGATLTWYSVNGDHHEGINDHCWLIKVTGAGPVHFAGGGIIGVVVDYLGAQLHNAIVEVEICEGDDALTIAPVPGHPGIYSVTYDLSSNLIQPGTAYWAAVAEVCNRMPVLGNNSSWNFQRDLLVNYHIGGPFDTDEIFDEYPWDGYEGYFKTKDSQFTASSDYEKTSCPEETNGYVEDGCIVVTIGDGESCWGLYNITIDGDLMLVGGEEAVGAGEYTFCGYGVGPHDVDVELVNGCNPPTRRLEADVVIPNGMDMVSPIITVADFFAGTLLANEGGDVIALGDMLIPEGSCSMKSYFIVTGVDNCDGEICDGDAVTAEATDGPANVDPGTQVQVYNQDQYVDTGEGIVHLQGCEWVVEINWSVGASEVTVCLDDAEEAGLSAPTCVTITANVIDAQDALIDAPAVNYTIPECQDQVTVFYSFQIDDGCDNDIDFDQVFFDAFAFGGISLDAITELSIENGYAEVILTFGTDGFQNDFIDDGLLLITYIDDFGNVYTAQPFFNLYNSTINADPVITTTGNAFTALACEDGGEVVLGVTVTDDCEDVLDDVKISGDGSGDLTAAPAVRNGTSAYFEFSGTLAADEYSFTFKYPGAGDVTVAVVVSQEDNHAPGVDMPGNTTFTIPSCQDDVTAVWSVQITDDCDEAIDLSEVCITVGGGACIAIPSANATVVSTGEGMALIELNYDLTLAANGAAFAVSYTDGSGATTSKSSTVSVNGTPDVIKPVIVYPTEAITKVLDPCGPNTTDIKFSVSAIDNCAGNVAVSVSAPGRIAMSSVPEGDADKWTITYAASATPYQITLSANDGHGNTTTQTMWVSVTQAPAPPVNLACHTGLQAPVGYQCEVELTPAMVLEGSMGCLTPADIEIVVKGKQRGAVWANYTEGTGLHQFDVYINGNYFCTGNITTYDNIPPSIECPADDPADYVCTDIDELLGTLEYTGAPSIGDNCSGATYDWYEEVLYGEDEACDDLRIRRVFTVTDGAGLKASCTQYITVRKPTLADVTGPDELIELSCDDEFEYDANGHPSPPETGGYPYVTTIFDDHNLAQTYCNLAATYSDSDLIEICEDSYKFIRTWTVLDWCHPGQYTTYTQLIKVGDFDDPIVTAPTADYDWDGHLDILSYSTGPFDCSGAFEVPMPGVTDNCSGWTVTTEILKDGTTPVLTIAPGANRFVSGIPMGCHAFRYWVTDGCGNQTDITVPFMVEDKVAPVAVCDDDLNISIGGQGYARVYATDIDEGSWDNCGPIRVEVRRLYNEDADCNPITSYFSEWGEYVDFSCCDIGDAVRIELQVWDDRNGDGIPGNTITIVNCDGQEVVVKDNSNTCWLDVTVEDKLNPYCVPPHNKTITCDALPYDFDPSDIELLEDLFGQADYADNCPGASVEENAPVITIDDCGTGTILRSFTATDAVGLTSTNSCQQLITITEVHNYEIRFPADDSADCGVADPDTITFNEIGCDLLAVSVEDEFFSASGDECYKIFRTYRVINWCEYDGEAPPVVVSRDEDCDGKPGDEAVWVLRRPNGAVYFDRDNVETNNNPLAGTKGTSCDGLTNPKGYWIDSYIDANATRDPITGQLDNNYTNDNIRNIDTRGYWQYTQVIKVYDSVDPVITVEAYDAFPSLDNVNCDGLVTINFKVEDECTREEGLKFVWLDAFINDADGDGNFTQAEFVKDHDVTAQITGDASGYTYSAELPQGTHALLIKGSDGCGNETVDLIIFEVVDTKAPAPVCINGLAVELMPTEPGTDADGDGDEDRAAMAIWANDFIASPIYDCNGQGPAVDANGNELVTAYSINLVGAEPNRDSTGIVLTCDNDETTIVEIHAWDEVGNHDYCETYVLVQDLMNRCEGGEDGAIAGNIKTEGGEGVADVEVSLSGFMNSIYTTQNDGYYVFHNLPVNDYSVAPQLDVNYLNGVSTFDLVLVSKHILGIQLLDSPYKMIAADANNSKSITTLDMIETRRNILGITNGFTNNTSWRFIDANYVFPFPNNPWYEQVPEIKSVNDLVGEIELNFVAVKISDVNASARPNGLVSIDDRSNGSFAFNVEDIAMVAGNTYNVDFTAKDIAAIAGYQGTFTFGEAIEMVDIVYGVAKEGNFGTNFVNEGMLTTSFNDEASADDVLFTLVVRANQDASLSEHLGLSSRVTPSEAYNNDGDKLDLAINFSTGKVQSVAFELYQNQPNPFQGETVIGYNLPEAAQVTFTVSDVAGRTLRTIRTEGAKGYNNILINSKDLPAAGVLYYTVSTDNYTATKKMIIAQ
ncbi:MAG: T9SS type A sorting domain-containing protein [Saprospiraceae bacterium]